MPGWPVAALQLLVLVSTVPIAAAFVPSPALIGCRPVAPTRSSGRSTISTSMSSSSTGYNWLSGGTPDPQALVRQGMDAFRKGSVQESIELFDQALALDQRIAPYLWQRCVRDGPPRVIILLPHYTTHNTTPRGLSLYYAGRFKEGAEQFRRDVAVNPSDTEEALWAFLCEAQMPAIGFKRAREQMLVVGRDPRPYCQKAYALFKGTATEEDLANEGIPLTPAEFYANLYLGLYSEARGEADKARACTLCRTGGACLRGELRRGSHNLHKIRCIHPPYRHDGRLQHQVCQAGPRLHGGPRQGPSEAQGLGMTIQEGGKQIKIRK